MTVLFHKYDPFYVSPFFKLKQGEKTLATLYNSL